MAVKHYMQPGFSLKQRVKILTVDPPTRRIEGALKDGGLIQIAVWETPPLFQWPQPEEFWTVYKENGYWMLGSKQEVVDGTTSIEDLDPGEAKIHAETIKTPSGRALLAIPDPDDGNVPVFQNGAWDSQVLSTADIALSSGTVVATADQVLSTSFADSPGLSLTIAPSIPIILLMMITLDIEITWASGGISNASAQLLIDNVAVNPQIISGTTAHTRTTVSQTFRQSLTAGSHTLKVQAKRDANSSSGTLHGVFQASNIVYILFAQ